MNEEHWLVCGTRGKASQEIVSEILNKMTNQKRGLYKDWKVTSIIKGCCPDSADVYAEKWAKDNDVTIIHHPATNGNYLKRNIEMVKKCTRVIAFWDGFSYGTAHTIAQATMRNIPVYVIKV